MPIKKYKLFLILLLLSCIVYSQSNSGFGFSSGLNSMKVKSNDLEVNSRGTGYSIGIPFLSFYNDTSDLLFELRYDKVKLSIDSYQDSDNNTILFDNFDKVAIQSLSAEILYNKYIILPEQKSIHLSVLGGLGTTLYNSWDTGDDDFFEDINHINPYFTFGLSGGKTENARITLKYNKFLGKNQFSNVNVYDSLDESNQDEREISGTISSFSISLTYFFNSIYR